MATLRIRFSETLHYIFARLRFIAFNIDVKHNIVSKLGVVVDYANTLDFVKPWEIRKYLPKGSSFFAEL